MAVSQWTGKVRRVKVHDIIAMPEFRLGVKTRRADQEWPREYDTFDMKQQQIFEHGRLWALVAPRDMLFVNRGKATDTAVEIYKMCKQDRIF